jgi:hypothetical protein
MAMNNAMQIASRYSEYNNVSFWTVKAGIVTVHGSADGHAVPKSWTVTVGSRTYRRQSAGEVRGLTLRGKAIAKVLRAIEAGRIG